MTRTMPPVWSHLDPAAATLADRAAEPSSVTEPLKQQRHEEGPRNLRCPTTLADDGVAPLGAGVAPRAEAMGVSEY